MHVFKVYMKLKGGTSAAGLDVTPNFHPARLLLRSQTDGGHSNQLALPTSVAALQVSKHHRRQPPFFISDGGDIKLHRADPDKQEVRHGMERQSVFKIKESDI